MVSNESASSLVLASSSSLPQPTLRRRWAAAFPVSPSPASATLQVRLIRWTAATMRPSLGSGGAI